MSDIQSFINKTLPIFVGATTLTYHKENNIFTTPANTSLAGNTYFSGIRLSERILIKTDIGEGYARTFLNGIRIISTGTSPKLLVNEYYHCCFYSEYNVKEKSKKLMYDFLIKKGEEENQSLDPEWLDGFCTNLIEGTYKDQMEVLKSIKANQLLNGGNRRIIG